jgi:hypothetical protein
MGGRRTEPFANGDAAHAETPAPPASWILTRWTLPPLPGGAMIERLFTPTGLGSTLVLAFAPQGDAGPHVAHARQARVAGAARAAELEAARGDLARVIDARDLVMLSKEVAAAEKEAAVLEKKLAMARAGADLALADPAAPEASGAAQALRDAEEALRGGLHRRDELRSDLARRRQELAEAARESAEAAVSKTDKDAAAEIDTLLATIAARIAPELERLDAARRRGHGHPAARAQAIDSLVQTLVAEAEQGGA